MEEMKTPRVCVYVKQSSDGEIVCLINACKGLYLVTSCSHSASWYDRGLVLVTSCSLLLSMLGLVMEEMENTTCVCVCM